jgi:aspartate/glutamate racemase
MQKNLTYNNFINDTIFSEICSESLLETEIEKFDHLAKDLFGDFSISDKSNIESKFIKLNKIAKYIFTELKNNNLLDQNFLLYINELERFFELELIIYLNYFVVVTNLR